MKFILIGNYKLDAQESMERFTLSLHHNLRKLGHNVEVIRPFVIFGNSNKPGNIGLNKWLGYLDKFLIFTLYLFLLRLRKSNNTIFHICDHSNATYLSILPKNRTGITCHDVLAIEGALGLGDAHCKASLTGRILQKTILHYLQKFKYLQAVSAYSMQHLIQLCPKLIQQPEGWKVIYNGFNADFQPIQVSAARAILKNNKRDIRKPFLFHIGSDLPRKNRKMLVYMMDQLKKDWDGQIVFAGKSLTNNIRDLILEKDLEDRVIEIHNPDHTELLALYSLCEAFVFPSFSEGFGWPLIEAQACGAPVISSRNKPLPEVGGNAAIYCDPEKPDEFVAAFKELNAVNSSKEALIKNGFDNIKRFENRRLTKQFLKMYADVFV